MRFCGDSLPVISLQVVCVNLAKMTSGVEMAVGFVFIVLHSRRHYYAGMLFNTLSRGYDVQEVPPPRM